MAATTPVKPTSTDECPGAPRARYGIVSLYAAAIHFMKHVH